ncbi:MAG: tetratricopeptide repeat protein [Promethearchaeota archaeon]
MVKVYSQLRVSCGLSAIINALQPEELKISPHETFAHWLDANWLRLTNNNDPSNPLVDFCVAREHKWAVVLDYILLRKIRSSFLLCKGISPAALAEFDLAEEDINWDKVIPIMVRIFDRLNQMTEDWPIWHYEGEFSNPEEDFKDNNKKLQARKMVQSIKIFYEIWESNIHVGPDADWKVAVSLPNFPETVTPDAIIQHIDHFKTNHELTALLETLGFVPDSNTGGKQYKANSLILINRPQHWVCENTKNPGQILDSLTVSTDTPRMGDTRYYYVALNNLKVFKKILPKLIKIFPDVEIELADEGLTEFPPLKLPITDNPLRTAEEYHKKAHDLFLQNKIDDALINKRIEVELLAKLINEHPLQYIENLTIFTDWCLKNDKTQTATENVGKLLQLQQKIPEDNLLLKVKLLKLLSDFYSFNEDYQKSADYLQEALELCQNDEKLLEIGYEIANGLGVSMSRQKNYQEALNAFKQAEKLALLALEKFGGEVAEDLTGPAKKYWPAILKGLKNKINQVTYLLKHNNPKKMPPQNALKRIDDSNSPSNPA